MFIKMWCSCVLVVYLFVLNVDAQNLGGFCRTPSGESAKCTNVYQCESLLTLLRAPSRTQEQTQFLASSKCGFNSAGEPYVCCGSGFNKVVSSEAIGGDATYIPNPSIPNRSECGWQTGNKIYNGEQADLDEFPWMVIIQYLTSSGNRRIACGGSLISSRYVLTAAHCITADILYRVGQPINVRLGEYNTSSPGRDCFQIKGIQNCNNPEINAGIEELIPHPGYTADNNRQHDIGLIRLDRKIPYSDFIQPICLPLPNEASRVGDILTVAGWGRTERGRDSDVKLKLQVPLVDTNSCANTFRTKNVQITKNQVCAGGEDGKDSCSGDSGGPLMRTLPGRSARWMIEGLVSFGYTCGTAGYPGVYTRVARYVPWIHKTLRA